MNISTFSISARTGTAAIAMLGLLAILLAVVGNPAAAESKIQVSVSIVPQKYFVQRIGGDRVEVMAMVQPGQSPHLFDPRPQQMTRLSRSDLYLAIGVNFEKAWLPRLTSAYPELKVMHMDRNIDKIPMASSGDTSQTILDPHVWTSPKRALKLAENTHDALVQVDSEHQQGYSRRYEQLRRELVKLDEELQRLFKDVQNMPFLVFHPAWGYLAHDYGLKQVPAEVEGKSPKSAQLQDIIRLARDRNIRVIFAQPQMSTRSAELIAREIGGEVVLADPLAADWMHNVRQQARAFKAALEQVEKEP
jgi:zinc transport system substrate-binding protein